VQKKDIVVAGVQTEAGIVIDVSYPSGITVDQLGNVYTVIMRYRQITR